MGDPVCDDYGLLLDPIADRRQLDAELCMDRTETRSTATYSGEGVVPKGLQRMSSMTECLSDLRRGRLE